MPGDDNSLIALCAECHSKKHPDLPKALFFNKVIQPYWRNKSASSLAKELGVHSRTVIRRAKKLQIAPGNLSRWDELLLKNKITKLNTKPVTTEMWMVAFSPRKMFVALECIKCGHRWRPTMSQYPWICPNCKSPDWDGYQMEQRRARRRIEDGVPYDSDNYLARKPIFQTTLVPKSEIERLKNDKATESVT